MRFFPLIGQSGDFRRSLEAIPYKCSGLRTPGEKNMRIFIKFYPQMLYRVNAMKIVKTLQCQKFSIWYTPVYCLLMSDIQNWILISNSTEVQIRSILFPHIFPPISGQKQVSHLHVLELGILYSPTVPKNAYPAQGSNFLMLSKKSL